MTDAQQREAARQVYYRWKDKRREDEDAWSYWIGILSDIFGVENVTQWLPSLSGYTLAGNYSLEVYMPSAENPEDTISYICVPLK